jgi:hypothetical protein
MEFKQKSQYVNSFRIVENSTNLRHPSHSFCELDLLSRTLFQILLKNKLHLLNDGFKILYFFE